MGSLKWVKAETRVSQVGYWPIVNRRFVWSELMPEAA